MEIKKQPNQQYDQVFGLDFFYSQFKTTYPAEMLGEKGIRNKRVSKQLYTKIISEYFDIYFKERYLLKRKGYFPFGGAMDLVKYPEKVIKAPKLKFKPPSFGFFWYQRPSRLFHIFVKLEKLTGKANRVPKIEKIFKENCDIDLIVTFDQAINQEQRNNLYSK